MTQTPYPYDDQIPVHSCNSIIPEAETLRYVGATHPNLPRPTTPLLDIAYTDNHFQLSDPSPVLHRGGLNSPRLAHPSHSLLPAESETPGDTSTDYGSLDFPQLLGIYSPWGSFHPLSNLVPDATYGLSPPTLHYPTVDPTLYSDLPGCQSHWSSGNVQVSSVDESPSALSTCCPPAVSLYSVSPFPDLHLEYTSEPYSRKTDTSAPYPCQWTESGVTCNATVLATRPHVNRHLHAYHGFGGSDTQPTRCCWAGCGETMQQGSIARHMVTCHLQTKVTCPMCSKKLSRQDVVSKHQRICPATGTRR